ncbi:hypothetical protein, partial [Enterococcus faecalis]|uniref:hypothetical protein n=1 Tax=Enterococcus faecalis TaxID=1351 RepID=UPI0013DFE1CF
MEESKENILEDSSFPNSKESVSKEELDKKEKNLMEESKENILEDSSSPKYSPLILPSNSFLFYPTLLLILILLNLENYYLPNSKESV